MTDRPEDTILAQYDRALREHGDTPQGALYANAANRRALFDVMLDLMADAAPGPVTLCDLACGTGELLARIRERRLDHIRYVGVDRSVEAIALARAKFPGVAFHVLDVHAEDADLGLLDCDYLVALGLFTFKHVMTTEQMRGFLEATIRKAWPHVRCGIAFNVMSNVVDWERDDLFHASMDDMARLLHGLAGRRVRLRADYGLWEFTCYAWREPARAIEPSKPASADAGPGEKVPVMRPLLPASERLLPYLRRIDATRIYSNFGPLVGEFESRLAGHFGLGDGCVVSTSTGTSALVGAILGSAGRAQRDRPLALMPAFTFVASAVAAQECGFEPYLADVDADSWLLEPDALLGHPQLDRVGLVMPVAAFGRPVDVAAWLRFRERTGIPVVVDAAASFEFVSAQPARCLGAIPVALSFHATKSLATGEGGCVVSSDPELVARIAQSLNFGFRFSRDSCTASTNGKMSEYHAAVGLAELDGWAAKQDAFADVVFRYRRALSAVGLAPRMVAAPDICSMYVLFRCGDEAESQRVQASLRDHRVEFRHWYGHGLQEQSYYRDTPADALPVTRRLAPCLLGLPMAIDLPEAMIQRVARALADGLSAR
jgi:dTDP-4-amino-4,6-dideoxygalactose transaminase